MHQAACYSWVEHSNYGELCAVLLLCLCWRCLVRCHLNCYLSLKNARKLASKYVLGQKRALLIVHILEKPHLSVVFRGRYVEKLTFILVHVIYVRVRAHTLFVERMAWRGCTKKQGITFRHKKREKMVPIVNARRTS